MTKDKRYNIVKNQILDNHIKALSEIFDAIPKSRVARDLGVDTARFTTKIMDVTRFRIDELSRLAKLIGVDEKVIFDLVYNQLKKKR